MQELYYLQSEVKLGIVFTQHTLELKHYEAPLKTIVLLKNKRKLKR